MTVGKLIKELEKLPPELPVLAAGEDAEKVIIEKGPEGNRYVRIFEPWDIQFIGGYGSRADQIIIDEEVFNDKTQHSDTCI